MTWQVKYAAENRVVCIEVSRAVNVAEIVESARAGRDLARTNGVHAILVDARRMTVAALTTELYRMPEVFVEQGLSRRYRVAIVVPEDPEEKERFAFIETVFVNRGFPLRLFAESAAALAWLRDEPGGGVADEGS